MSGRTPQQMTRDNLTARGYLVGTVEGIKRFPDNKKRECGECGHRPEVQIKIDLFNFADIIAIHPGTQRTILVQTTDRTHHATRRNKILSSMEAKLCLLAGVPILLQSWRQNADTKRWQALDEWIDLDQFKQAPHYPNTVAELVEIKRRAKRPDLPPGTTLPLSMDFEEIPF